MKYQRQFQISKPRGGLVRVGVEVEIDAEKLAQLLAQKAMRNRSRRSHGFGGLVKARIVSEEPAA